MIGRRVCTLVALLLTLPRAAQASPARADTSTRESATPADAPPLRQRIAAFSSTALGLSGSGFVNELAGARLELAYTPRLTLGFGVAYANLKGKDGRASNVLPEAILGYRVPLGSVVGWPVHLAGGYLPKNGPTLRIGTGLDFALGGRAVLELTLLEPMVWVTRNRPESSLDLGAALSVGW